MANYFFWSAAPGGSTYYRAEAPAAVLTRLGHTAIECRYALTSWAQGADAIQANRVCQPAPSTRWREWRQQGRFLVWDIDDDPFAIHADSDSYDFFAQPGILQAMQHNAAIADRVTCCSDRIADVFASHNPNVVVIPNGLPAEVLWWPRRPSSEQVTVGWVGSPQSLPELQLVARALNRLLDTTSHVDVHIIGVTSDQAGRYGLTHPRVRYTPWVHGTIPYLRTVDFDVWVAPYRRTPFNQAKYPTKALEAAFLGIPLIASDTEPYERFIRHGETGLLVRRDHEWAQHLRLLVGNHDLRERMGSAAHLQASLHTIEGFAPLWAQALTP